MFYDNIHFQRIIDPINKHPTWLEGWTDFYEDQFKCIDITLDAWLNNIFSMYRLIVSF